MLVAGTNIILTGYSKPVEQVQIGDFVLTRNGYREVLSAGETQAGAPVFKLTTMRGSVIRATGSHLVWTDTQQWVPMSSLSPGDILLGLNCSDNVVSVTADGFEDVYGLTMSDPEYPELYTNGVLFHHQ